MILSETVVASDMICLSPLAVARLGPNMFTYRSLGSVVLSTVTLLAALGATAPADDTKRTAQSSSSEKLPPNIKRLIHHGAMLTRPKEQPENTTKEVAYELGRCLQLDRDHCLVVASMDEQGGGDLGVGNDAFVIQKLCDLKTANAIPLNRAVKDYALMPGGGKAFLAKYPGVGWFVPRGALLADGKPHPAAGTGVLFSCTSPFHTDKTTQDIDPQGKDPKREVEVMQVRWDGSHFEVVSHVIVPQLMDLELTGSTPLGSCPQDEGVLFSFGTIRDGVVVYRFDWNGKEWAPTRHGKAFTKDHSETETSLRQQGDTYYVQTRCRRATGGNLYRSKDGLEYEFAGFLDTHCGCPVVLNEGLDGSLYVASNYSPGWVRNPLEATMWDGDHFGQRFILHDQDGVRGDKGSSKPFVDHGVASNVFLEGRWRHLVFYRCCDLMERTLHGFQLQQGMGDVVYGKGKGPIPRRPWSGMYVVELEYDHVTTTPYQFN